MLTPLQEVWKGAMRDLQGIRLQCKHITNVWNLAVKLNVGNSMGISSKHDLGSSDEYSWICKGILCQNQMVKDTQTTFLIYSTHKRLVRWELVIKSNWLIFLQLTFCHSEYQSWIQLISFCWYQHGKWHPSSTLSHLLPQLLPLEKWVELEDTEACILTVSSAEDYLASLQ